MLWARCAMAAVATSPPQLSSIVMAMPMATQKSRISRALVRPPTLPILRLIASIAPSAWPRATMSSPSITSSRMNGLAVRRRTVRQAS